MKLTRFLSKVLTLLGLAAAAGSIMLIFSNLEAKPLLLEAPEAASVQAEALMAAVSEGDYAAAGALLYGTPDLGISGMPEGEAQAMMWRAYQDSFSYEFVGDCYATDAGVARTVSITALNPAGVMDAVTELAPELLATRVTQADDLAEIYDEKNEYREEFVMAVLCDALSQVLENEPVYQTTEVAVNLICRQGQWWVVPDQALMNAISGGTAG